MTVYSYSATQLDGTRVRGEKIASSVVELREYLINKGLIPEKIKRKNRGIGILSQHRTNSTQVLLFVQEFTALVGAGLTIPDALTPTQERPDSSRLSGILRAILADVRTGIMLSDAASKFPNDFSQQFIATLKTGERSGQLVKGLAGYQKDLRFRISIEKKISQTMAYPIFLAIILVIILSVLFAFVMPRFLSIYADFEAELPLPTKVLISIVDNLGVYSSVFGLLLLIGGGVFRNWKKQENGKRYLNSLKIKLPWVGEIYQLSLITRTTKTLSTLLASGMPLVEALGTVEQAVSATPFEKKIYQTKEDIITGKSFAASLKTHSVLPKTGLKLIEVGEASGSLEKMLTEVSEYYQERFQDSITRMMTYLEPLLMLAVGLIIGSIILIMYLPIFYIAEVVK